MEYESKIESKSKQLLNVQFFFIKPKAPTLFRLYLYSGSTCTKVQRPKAAKTPVYQIGPRHSKSLYCNKDGGCAHAICNSGAACWRPSALSSAAQGSMPPLPFQYSSSSGGGAHSLHTLPQPVGSQSGMPLALVPHYWHCHILTNCNFASKALLGTDTKFNEIFLY